MKRIGALVFIAAYLTVSNYCLAYALVTGEGHKPFQTVEAKESKAPSHPGCPGHSSSEATSHSGKSRQNDHANHPCHKQSSGKSSEDCCVTFSADNPVVITQRFEVAKPIFSGENLPVLIEPVASGALRTYRIGLDHGPPGLSSLKATSSHLTPRAPPSYL